MRVDTQLVRNERLKRTWSQEQLAQVSGLGLRTVQRIESGGNASLETAKSLAAVFELPVDALLVESAPPPGTTTLPLRFNLFRPWRTFAAGCMTALITMGGFVSMQGALAEQVDLDFALRLHGEELSRSRAIGNAGSPIVVEVAERVKITVTPAVREDGLILVTAEICLYQDGEFKIIAKPTLLAENGKKGMFRVGKQSISQDGEMNFEGIEFEITPMLE